MTQAVPFDTMAADYDRAFSESAIGRHMRAAVWRRLDAAFQPGARALLCVMGPLVPWEWGWYLAHGQPRKAFRRLRAGGTPWRGLTIRYPSAGALRRAFAPHFAARRVAAVGALIPPSYAEPWAA